MSKKSLSIWIVIIILIILGIFWLKKNEMRGQTNATENATTSTTEASTTPTPITFTDPQSKEKVAVVFGPSDDTATMNGLGFEGVVLHAATSGSGARYVNTEKGLQVWNVGDTVTVSENGEQTFFGNIGGLTNEDKLESSTWTWLATTEDGTVTEPKDKDAFTLTFTKKEGMLHATTDCNTIFGPYTVGENNTLSFGALGMTKKYCEGSQEQIFADGLGKVKSFWFNGSGALVLQFASSSDTMLFGKAGE